MNLRLRGSDPALKQKSVNLNKVQECSFILDASRSWLPSSGFSNNFGVGVAEAGREGLQFVGLGKGHKVHWRTKEGPGGDLR